MLWQNFKKVIDKAIFSCENSNYKHKEQFIDVNNPLKGGNGAIQNDIARYKNNANPGDVIIKWKSNKSSFDYYCLWEELFNDNFKLAESREFKNDSAIQAFTMIPSQWCTRLNAVGMTYQTRRIVLDK